MQARQFLDIEKQRKTMVVRLPEGGLDLEMARFVHGQLFLLIRESIRPTLRLDLGRVEFVTAAGLGKLVALLSEVRKAGGKLTFCNVSSPVYEVFRAARLTDMLGIQHEEGIAVRSA